jgi:hypothetical protein
MYGDTLMHLFVTLGIGTWTEAAKHMQIINPKTNLSVIFGGQLSGQTPSHTDVAEIIDYGAEDIPPGTHSYHSTFRLTMKPMAELCPMSKDVQTKIVCNDGLSGSRKTAKHEILRLTLP